MIPGAIKYTHRPYTVLTIGNGTVAIDQFGARHELVSFVKKEVERHKETHIPIVSATGFHLLAIVAEQRDSIYIILTTAR